MWDAAFETLPRLGPPADEERAIDSTIVRAHQHAADANGECRKASARSLARRLLDKNPPAHQCQRRTFDFDVTGSETHEITGTNPGKLLGDRVMIATRSAPT